MWSLRAFAHQRRQSSFKVANMASLAYGCRAAVNMLAIPDDGPRLGLSTLSASHLGSDQSENYGAFAAASTPTQQTLPFTTHHKPAQLHAGRSRIPAKERIAALRPLASVERARHRGAAERTPA